MSYKNQQMVSVVVMTFQSSKFIFEALESIKNQTWGNIELIISDDASTDNTVKICREFIEKNRNRFLNSKIITSNVNTGIPSNYNRGIKAASGDWIKFVDADDILLDSCIQDYLVFTQKYPNAKFITSDVVEIDEDSKIIRENVKYQGMQYILNKSSCKEQLKEYARFPFFINSPTFFVKRSFLQEIDFCDEEFRIYEDITLAVKTLIKGVKIDYLRVPTVKYRIHLDSISRSKSSIDIRNKEEYLIFKKYRAGYLNILNPIDLSIYYETWLFNVYKGFYGKKGLVVLQKLSLYYWYLKFNRVYIR